MLFAVSLSLAACTRQEPEKKPEPTRIVFVTDWKAQAEHGGFYEALAEGLYEKRELNVSLMQGGPGVNVPQLIAGGAADFGIGSNGFIPLNMLEEGVGEGRNGGVPEGPSGSATHPRADVRLAA